jgi:hypothetical protein
VAARNDKYLGEHRKDVRMFSESSALQQTAFLQYAVCHRQDAGCDHCYVILKQMHVYLHLTVSLGI